MKDDCCGQPALSKAASPKIKRRRSLILTAAVILVFVIAGVCSRYWFQLMLIQGDSMLPAYHHLQLTVLDKRHAPYQRGDVIAFRCEALGSILVKRLVALPGDTIVIENGTLYVNGEISRIYDEEGAFDYSGLLTGPLILKDEEYFAIGDNIAESKDSRYPDIGIIIRDTIIGKIAGS